MNKLLEVYSKGFFNTLKEEEIEAAVEASQPDVIMHTNSTYPCPVEDLNLRYITLLKEKYKNKEIGYSGHEKGIISTLVTIPSLFISLTS